MHNVNVHSYKMAAVRHLEIDFNFSHLYPTMSFYFSRPIIRLNLKSVALMVLKLELINFVVRVVHHR